MHIDRNTSQSAVKYVMGSFTGASVYGLYFGAVDKSSLVILNSSREHFKTAHDPDPFDLAWSFFVVI